MLAHRGFVALLGLGAAVLSIGCGASTGKAGAALPAGEVEVSPPSEAVALAAERAKEKVYSNRIKWKTASELDNFGYSVYRGESPEGPFERITLEVIEGAGTTDEPTAYEYVDNTIDPYQTYYYYVESISMNGDRERFTPIGRAKPKLSRETEESANLAGDEAPGSKR